MSYIDHKRRPNRFRTRNDYKSRKFPTEEHNNNNNNNNNECKTQVRYDFKKQSKFESNFRNNSEKPRLDSICFKINDRSKGVKKGKAKTPAQDRLQKIFEKRSLSESVKQLVNLKSSVANSVKITPSSHVTVGDKLENVAVKCTNGTVDTKKSGEIVENSKFVAPVWNDVSRNVENPANQRNSSEFPPLLPPKQLSSFEKTFSPNANRMCHNVQVQSHLKLNDKSKTIGVKKTKLKTPAQDRLQKFADKNKAALLESLKELVDVPIISDAKKQHQSIGMQKSHVTGIEPSITSVVSRTVTMNNATDSAYIIPDTNVFVHSLACIKNVFEKDLKYSVLIPYVVLQELDNLKRRGGENNFTVKHNATRAIRYIYELIQAENERLRGQTAIEDTKRLIDVSSNDDKILNCCLQLIAQSKEVILVTNDLNLTNIAKLSGVNTITFKRCLEKFQ